MSLHLQSPPRKSYKAKKTRTISSISTYSPSPPPYYLWPCLKGPYRLTEILVDSLFINPLSMYEGNVKITQQINNLALAPPCTAPHPQKVMCSLNPRNQKKPHAPHLCYGEFGCVQYVAPGAVIGCDKYSLSCQDIVIVSFSLFWRVRITKRIFLRIKFILSNMMNRSI